MNFSGSFVPLITPFDRKGRIDVPALEKLVEWHISSGTDGIVCAATTGEGPTLSAFEKKQVAEVCLAIANGRVPVIVSTGTNDTRASIQNTQSAQKLGASGCLVVTPYYNNPSQKGCIAHFEEIARVGLPMILYHNPPRAVVRLTVDTILYLSKNPIICAIKESSHDLEFVRRIEKHIPVFSGDDDLTYKIMRLGGIGSIATTANVIPKGWKNMIESCRKKDWVRAEKLAQRYLPLSQSIFLETNPQGVKYALFLLRKCGGALRLPMLTAGPEAKQQIQKEILSLAIPTLGKVVESCK